MKTINFPESADRPLIGVDSIVIAVDGLLDVTVTLPVKTLDSIKAQATAAGDDFVDYLLALAHTVERRSLQSSRASGSTMPSRCASTHRKASP